MRKPQRGKCGVCGTVMPGPDKNELAAATENEFTEVWVMGHRYIWSTETAKWVLTTVRCNEHVEHPMDPRKNEGW